MFAQGGIKVNGVVAQPYNVYATAAGKQQFSAFIFSLGNTSPTSATGLRNLLMTVDKDAGQGSFNRTRYSNEAFDAKMRDAMAEFDPEKRNALLVDATALAIADDAVIPLFWPGLPGRRRRTSPTRPIAARTFMATMPAPRRAERRTGGG